MRTSSVTYTIRIKFFRIPNVASVKMGENTCSLEFYELPFSTIPASRITGGKIRDDYTDGVWNDAVNIVPDSPFFDPFEKFMHPPHYVDPKTGKRMSDCETKGKPNFVDLVLTDDVKIGKQHGGAGFLYFYSVLRISGGKKCGCAPVQKIFMGHLTSTGWAAPTSEDATAPATPPLPFK